MADENGEKTEEATDKRRSESRQKGNVARSTDLNAAGLLFAGAAAMKFFGPDVVQTMAGILKSHLQARDWPQQLDAGFVVVQFWEIAVTVATGVLPLMLAMAAASLMLNLAQVGFLASGSPLQPKFSRLNPLEGVKRIFSVRGLVKLGVSLGKLTVVGLIAVWFIHGQLGQMLGTIEYETSAFAIYLGSSLINLAFTLAGALLLLAFLDYGFQLWKFEQDLMMTKQEVRDEMKNMEGDPLIRQQRREAHRKLATSREMQQVTEADVVITNPTELAIAIKYNPESTLAPVVVAKGAGHMAQRIRTIAARHKIPIVEKKPLARTLYKTVKVGQQVPADLYEAIAEILAYVYRLSGKAAQMMD